MITLEEMDRLRHLSVAAPVAGMAIPGSPVLRDVADCVVMVLGYSFAGLGPGPFPENEQQNEEGQDQEQPIHDAILYVWDGTTVISDSNYQPSQIAI